MGRFPLRAAIAVAILVSVPIDFAGAEDKRHSRPNIVVILVNDQDYLLGSMDHMDNLQTQLIQQGAQFTKHYGHDSQSGPARATLWTGKHAHNTNVTSSISGVAGSGWEQIQAKEWYNDYLPVWLQEAGYSTYMSGKLFSGFGFSNYCNPVCLKGWTRADILVVSQTNSYYNSSYAHYDGRQWTLNHRVPGYSTDQIAQNVSDFIGQAAQWNTPFFAVAVPIAAHNVLSPPIHNNLGWSFPVPKEEYAELYPDLQLPKSPNFNPDNKMGVSVVWWLEQLSETNVGKLNEVYKMRQRALKSVDDLVSTIIQKLDDSGVLDNTYIFYTSDNGYHIGNHRLQDGKLQCFEEDVNVPFIIRGPNVGKYVALEFVTGHVDLAPTILGLAGIHEDPSWALDGNAISFPLKNELDYIRNLEHRGELALLESWAPFQQEGPYRSVDAKPGDNLDIYKAVRIQGKGYNLMYSVWCQDSAHELYDMAWDPYQMTNLHPDAPAEPGAQNAYNKGMNTLIGRPTEEVIHRLDALVLILKTCVADVCCEPWKELHPNGNVKTLAHALHEKYDDLYKRSYSFAKVGWKQCYSGMDEDSSVTLYDLDNEEPVWLNETIVQLAGIKRCG